MGTDAPTSLAPEIRVLPPLLVNQIAAGEVIERPASVVKELVENALDAGGQSIRIELERGGTDLIAVTDNGRGIAPEQLPLALAPHATSKIAEQHDLDRIGTFGFRGEAVASIASVGRLSIRSATEGGEAHEIRANEDGSAGPVRPASGPKGTRVEVRDLFYNTPARRKFLKTPATEKTRCLDWVRDLAMANPSVGFEVIHDGSVALDLPAGQGPRDRAVSLLGQELEEQLVEVGVDEHDDARGVSIWGLVGLPALARATNKAQHVFLNGRVIRDRVVQHAIKEAYRGLVEPGRHPTAVLMIEMPPAAVDVNVHPAKLEVRFRDQSMIHSAVLRAIRRGLQSKDLTPDADAIGRGPKFDFGPGLTPFPASGAGQTERFLSSVKEALKPDREGSVSYDQVQRTIDEQAKRHFVEQVEALREPSPAQIEVGSATPRARVLQVHQSFLITQDEQGVVIIDQHALHERIMFEQLLERVLGGGDLESQSLLTPAAVDCAASQIELLEKLSPLCARIGLGLEAFGLRSVGITSVPTFLFERSVDPAEFVSELLEKAEREKYAPNSEEALRDVLDMMSCKAAVKAGDRLSDTELDELLELRAKYERSSNCPHGRPTTVRLSITELERLFGRR